MERALALALKGWGRVAPNPLVGAVLLKGGEIVGEGWHREFGGAHAEIAAIESCESPSGSTCVVNLEPCTHHGKTPPCTDALLEAGIHRLVFATRDPDPTATGGAELLRRAGLEVVGGVLQAEAAALNAPFLTNHVRTDVPYVALKLATSLDGFIADRSRSSQWISGEQARSYVQWLRAGFGGVAVGLATVEQDDPQLTVRGEVEPRIPPVRIVFTRSGNLSLESQLVKTSRVTPTILVVARGRSAAAAERLGGTAVEVLSADGLGEALQALRGKGVHSILVEGGGVLARALLEDSLVDRIYWIQAPILLGSGVPGLGLGSPRALAEAWGWTPSERRSLGGDTLLVVDREPCLPV